MLTWGINVRAERVLLSLCVLSSSLKLHQGVNTVRSDNHLNLCACQQLSPGHGWQRHLQLDVKALKHSSQWLNTDKLCITLDQEKKKKTNNQNHFWEGTFSRWKREIGAGKAACNGLNSVTTSVTIKKFIFPALIFEVCCDNAAFKQEALLKKIHLKDGTNDYSFATKKKEKKMWVWRMACLAELETLTRIRSDNPFL